MLLDGRTFSQGDISITFKATDTGNSHVRLYGSYDAGCDLRIYDGESITVRSLNDKILISSIAFDISLSGTSDVDFDPSAGEYDWLATTWYAAGESVTELTLTSIDQSRMSAMTVVVEPVSGVSDVAVDATSAEEWFDLSGRRVGADRMLPGIYLHRIGDSIEKVVVR